MKFSAVFLASALFSLSLAAELSSPNSPAPARLARRKGDERCFGNAICVGPGSPTECQGCCDPALFPCKQG
ncbi:hypothetical protein HYFRA_00013881 [Hymenoscyphus fraxineus]|uniref:Uncharacterized protein n=1 Tax=Hymenoscyphus fraxineus TaxID=746836 RepID=A0A9N9PVJ5_9HELO|nr:hypothetical protein HYFRA_00013881 [Hymenoscyphus fraxineus]